MTTSKDITNEARRVGLAALQLLTDPFVQACEVYRRLAPQTLTFGDECWAKFDLHGVAATLQDSGSWNDNTDRWKSEPTATVASDLCDLSGFLSDVWEWMLTECDELIGSSDFHAAGALAISAGLIADGDTYADCAQLLDTATNFLILAGVDIDSALMEDDDEAKAAVAPSNLRVSPDPAGT